jgi:hypothetical protein
MKITYLDVDSHIKIVAAAVLLMVPKILSSASRSRVIN